MESVFRNALEDLGMPYDPEVIPALDDLLLRFRHLDINSILQSIKPSGWKISVDDLKTIPALHEQQDDGSFKVEIINANNVPKMYFGDSAKSDQNFTRGLKAPPPKVWRTVHEDRYKMLQQKISRFFPSAVSGHHMSQKFVEVGSLPNKGRKGCLAFGMLIKEQGDFFLVDPSGTIKLDLSTAKRGTGFYTAFAFVLLEGWAVSKHLFQVNAVTNLPLESKETILSHMEEANFDRKWSNLLRVDKSNMEFGEEQFFFFKDLHLDRPGTLQKLEKIFEVFDGFEDDVGRLFVFTGNFFSDEQSSFQPREHFIKFADILKKYKNLLKYSKFVFVPGPDDFGMTNSFQKGFFPPEVTKIFNRSRFKNIIFSTNPCRIWFKGQEILVYRENSTALLFEKSILQPSVESVEQDIFQSVCSTLLGQMHCAPFNSGIHDDWGMQMPLPPDVLVLCDSSIAGCINLNESNPTKCVNPGSWLDHKFLIYKPDGQVFEPSGV